MTGKRSRLTENIAAFAVVGAEDCECFWKNSQLMPHAGLTTLLHKKKKATKVGSGDVCSK